MTLVALLRHAQTDWNLDKRIQGRTDIALNAAGRASLKDRILPPECDGMRVVSSPLRRCLETAALLGVAEPLKEQRIIEMHWGEWEGRKLSELRAALGERMDAKERLGLDFRPPGGETPREVLIRVSTWLADIASAGIPTLAITHRGIIRSLLVLAYGWNMLGKPPVKLESGSFHLFRLDPAGRPAPWRINLQ